MAFRRIVFEDTQGWPEDENESSVSRGGDTASALRLSQLTADIKSALQQHFGRSGVWVVAEIADVKVAASGHVYLDLVEREGSRMLAKSRANCWRSSAQRLIPKFEKATRHPLRPGMEVLIRVEVSFHDQYGLSLTVNNIDPNYTLGELARQRQALIEQLTREGLMTQNSHHDMPLVVQRVAVISSATAAGYEDFSQQMRQCQSATIAATLFEATVQGDQAEASMVHQLKAIEKQSSLFDVIVIIRGGGASTDMACFDTYGVCQAVAQSSLPVITGIGHERDESVTDMVAHTSLKTPTAVAAWIVARAEDFVRDLDQLHSRLQTAQRDILHVARQQLREQASHLVYTLEQTSQRERTRLHTLGHRLTHFVQAHWQQWQTRFQRVAHTMAHLPTVVTQRETARLSAIAQRMLGAARHVQRDQANRIGQLRHDWWRSTQGHLRHHGDVLVRLDAMQKALDPARLLRRGFSITRLNGKTLRDETTVQTDDIIETQLMDGTITSRVTPQQESPKHG